MLYTRGGDDGMSGLFATAERFSKDHPIYHALGTLDELNSFLGICRAHSPLDGKIDIAKEVRNVQECLFVIQAELAGAQTTLESVHIEHLEKTIEVLESFIEDRHAFVIPGSTELSALFDYARTIARRAERAVVGTHAQRELSVASRAYLNRISSLLYAIARYFADEAGVSELSPEYKKSTL
jgi:cob(I)alamin adenosyltransferase